MESARPTLLCQNAKHETWSQMASDNDWTFRYSSLMSSLYAYVLCRASGGFDGRC